MKDNRDAPLTAKTISRYWSISLIGGVVVIAAVAKLLDKLTKTAEEIQGGVHQIWLTGKRIANNTVHIPMLVRTNQVAGDILDTADKIAHATGRIERAVKGTSNN